MKPCTTYCCEQMNLFLKDSRVAINYSPIYRKYSIPLLYKGKITALQGINFCPWCGKKLPKNLHHEWFTILTKEYHIEDPYDKKEKKLIPKEFQSNQWWKKRNL